MKRVLVVILALLVVASLAAASGCGETDVTGSYLEQGQGTLLELKEDGTFSRSLGEWQGEKGTYEVEDGEVLLYVDGQPEDMPWKLAIEANQLVDMSGGFTGMTFVKQE